MRFPTAHLVPCSGFIRVIIMNLALRIVLALGLVLLDAVVFFAPIGALLLAYIIVFNPPWFREFLLRQAR